MHEKYPSLSQKQTLPENLKLFLVVFVVLDIFSYVWNSFSGYPERP